MHLLPRRQYFNFHSYFTSVFSRSDMIQIPQFLKFLEEYLITSKNKFLCHFTPDFNSDSQLKTEQVFQPSDFYIIFTCQFGSLSRVFQPQIRVNNLYHSQEHVSEDYTPAPGCNHLNRENCSGEFSSLLPKSLELYSEINYTGAL